MHKLSHLDTLQLHKVKVVVSFIFEKRTVRTNELQTQSVVKLVATDFCWLVATPTASQQHKKIFFLATSTLLQVPIPVPVLKIQVPVQVPVLCMQVQVPVPVPSTTRLYFTLSTYGTGASFNFKIKPEGADPPKTVV